MTDRFIIDDAGTLIDIETRDTYDYVSEVAPILNELNKEKEYLKKVETSTDELLVNQFQENQKIKRTIEEAHYNERTKLGRSVLKQLLEAIQ